MTVALVPTSWVAAGTLRGKTLCTHRQPPLTAILEVAAHVGFDALDTVAHVLTCLEVLDQSLIKVVQPEDVPNPIWLTSASASPNQQKFADALLAEHSFVLIPPSRTNTYHEAAG